MIIIMALGACPTASATAIGQGTTGQVFQAETLGDPRLVFRNSTTTVPSIHGSLSSQWTHFVDLFRF